MGGAWGEGMVGEKSPKWSPITVQATMSNIGIFSIYQSTLGGNVYS